MFCPLCKYEYRTGFRECSDCRVSLVATKAEADAASVQILWQGDSRHEMERVLDNLVYAGIPHRSHEGLKSEPWPWISMLFFRFAKPKPTSEFKVWVFGSDFERATATIKAQPLKDPDEDDDA